MLDFMLDAPADKGEDSDYGTITIAIGEDSSASVSLEGRGTSEIRLPLYSNEAKDLTQMAGEIALKLGVCDQCEVEGPLASLTITDEGIQAVCPACAR